MTTLAQAQKKQHDIEAAIAALKPDQTAKREALKADLVVAKRQVAEIK